MGAFIELCYIGLAHGDNAAAMTDLINRIGASRIVLSTDLGERHRVPPAEGLALFAEELVDSGVSPNDVSMALNDNPRWLLSLS